MTEYETVGVVDADVAATIPTDSQTIIVEHEDPDTRLLARPKEGSH